MPVGLSDLPLELLVIITNNLSVESCNNLAKVGPRLRAAVNVSLKNISCHVQGYWREQDPKFEVIFERNGDEVLLARNIVSGTTH
uniref:Cyclin F-box domain containing protein n=1 Tax=Haemonchus contortus TaxID=6289 RepID=W6NCP2_HAECO